MLKIIQQLRQEKRHNLTNLPSSWYNLFSLWAFLFVCFLFFWYPFLSRLQLLPLNSLFVFLSLSFPIDPVFFFSFLKHIQYPAEGQYKTILIKVFEKNTYRTAWLVAHIAVTVLGSRQPRTIRDRVAQAWSTKHYLHESFFFSLVYSILQWGCWRRKMLWWLIWWW